MGNDAAPPAVAAPEKKSGPADASTAKPATATSGEKQLYNGKSHDAWRNEFEIQEAELNRLEQHLEQLKNQLVKPSGITKEQFATLKKDYDDTRATYNQKYKIYSDLIESARKAGLTVEMKK
jgi:hypothetical protein